MDNIRITVYRLLHLATAAILSAAILLCCGVTASAAGSVECEYIQGNNIDSNDYSMWSSPVYSYLVKNGTGYMRVQGSDDGKIAVAYYDSGFNVTSRKTVTGELPLFGGFYASGGNYYIVTGKKNPNPNPNQGSNAEVYRITKYNSSWERQGSCSLWGENTYEPFAYGSCRMVMDGNYLLIRTCHTMYTDSNGINHQANVTIEVNTSSMTVTDKYTKVWNVNGGYVSHSFNQFIGIDGSHHIVAVDHGDASPRSICLMRYNTNVTSGRFSTDTGVTSTDVFSFAGTYENQRNTTGASVGAFELIGSNYLIAGNSVARYSNTVSGSTRNIFVLSTNGGRKWLTGYAEGEETVSTPHMVRINSNKFMVLWSRGDNVHYTFIDANGNQQGSTYSVPGHLSDCAPIYDGSRVVWYTYNNGKENFYVIPVSSPTQTEVINRTYGHNYQFVSAENGVATVKCSRCGSVTTGNVPTGLSVYWKLGSSSSGSYNGSARQHVPYGDSVEYWPIADGGDDSDSVFSELEFIPDDSANVIVDTDKEKIRFLKPGKYTVTAGPKYNPSVREEYTFYVYNPLKSVSLRVYNQGPLKAGDEVIVFATPEGGGYIEYFFEITTPTGEVLNHSQYDMTGVGIRAGTPGTFTVKVTAYNLSDSSEAAVTSAPLTFVVEPSSDGGSGSSQDPGSTVKPENNAGNSQTGIDGTAVGKGASAAAADKAIRNATSEEGPSGTRFAALRARSTKQTKTSVTLKWGRVTGAARYVIYGTKCGKSNKMKRICTASGASRKITKAAGKKLKKGTYYKFIIVALDKNDKVISASKVVHAATKGGKVGNHKKVTVKKAVIKKAGNLKAGATLKLKAKAVKASYKPVKIHRAVRYETTNRKIATVTKKGVVKAKKKGTCYIYAFAQNGVYKKIKIVVK